jgi:medium-chain acyl-[acyl-carrier-protein] hydrolase
MLAPDVEVCALQLPGRESRLREAPLTELDQVISAVTTAIRPYLTLPFAFFGHSMGAGMAFELSRSLARGGDPLPNHLFVSGRRGPRLPEPDPPIHDLPDDQFIAEMRDRYGGIPDEVAENPELLELLLPCLRADMTVFETHAFVDGDPVPCPISAFGGEGDWRAGPKELEAWRQETNGSFAMKMFPGGHFFIQTALAEVLQAVSAELRSSVFETAMVKGTQR